MKNTLQNSTFASAASKKALSQLPDWQRKEQTALIFDLLVQYAEGLSKEELLETFYEDYRTSSLQRRASLAVRMNKLLQRARARFRSVGLDVAFDAPTRRWRASMGDTLRISPPNEPFLGR
jgi:hypothetical protein